MQSAKDGNTRCLCEMDQTEGDKKCDIFRTFFCIVDILTDKLLSTLKK